MFPSVWLLINSKVTPLIWGGGTHGISVILDFFRSQKLQGSPGKYTDFIFNQSVCPESLPFLS